MSVWLIAEREFRAYAGTLSFWIALVVAPLLMAGALALGGLTSRPSPPLTVQIAAADAALAGSARAALAEAAGIDGHALAIAGPTAKDVPAHLDVFRLAGGVIEARFSGPLPLSPAGRALFARDLERRQDPRLAGDKGPAVDLVVDRAPARGGDPHAFARFATVMMLWLALTGSLGMLLQAVVRERVNRSLESLLAAVSPTEIVFGKLLGVGAVSALVIVAWLGSVVALAPFAPASGQLMTSLFRDVGDPAALARACVLYIAAFAFYGLVTVAIGSLARDGAAAQNLVRPMFAVLLAAFFAALVATSGAQLGWLVYLPPFTPFMLLLRPMDQGWSAGDLVAFAALLAATIGAGAWAVKSLTLAPGPAWTLRKVPA